MKDILTKMLAAVAFLAMTFGLSAIMIEHVDYRGVQERAVKSAEELPE